MIRSAFFIDGFNAYHSLDDLKKPYLKWLDWWALAAILIPSQSEAVAEVIMCTATRRDNVDKQLRHRRYLAALKSKGVTCLEGHFAQEKRICRSCGKQWTAPVEKQGDVNLAISIIHKAHLDLFDHCYLVTADGDQAATARLLKQNFPNKRLTTVVITGREHSRQILRYADAKLTISLNTIERALLPKLIPGAAAILRPVEYDPPA